MTITLKDFDAPAAPASTLSADQAIAGPYIPPQQQIMLYSPDQWEGFIHEWVHFCLKKQYQDVQRFSGPGDLGIDVAGFADGKKLQGVWDNFQCKHYATALAPSDAWPEIGKILWHSFKGDYTAPRKYFFLAPRGAGTKLARLLANPEKLKQGLAENWDKHCSTTITQSQKLTLDGQFLDYVNGFDFSIFAAKTSLAIIDDHRGSSFHVARFGGGLPNRPKPTAPPATIAPIESRYIDQLLRAYTDHAKTAVAAAAALKQFPKLEEHFGRQRVAFYHAESLRVFARDSVPPGTFESLQDDIHSGVVDICDADHPDGYRRVCEVTKAARDLQITSNALITRSKPLDRDGICHQLANEDRLRWTKP
jgi:hypothetical protein